MIPVQEIIYQYLSGVSSDYDLGGDWPAYVGYFPDNASDTNSVAVLDRTGINLVRCLDNTVVDQYGVQILVRAPNVEVSGVITLGSKIAGTKAFEIKLGLDAINRLPVTVDGTIYEITSVRTLGPPEGFGITDDADRWTYSLNMLVHTHAQ